MVDSTSSCSASARKPTWPRLTPSSGVLVAWVSSAARRIEPSPPMTSTSSQPSPGSSSGPGRLDEPVGVGPGPGRRPRRPAAVRRCRARSGSGRTPGPRRAPRPGRCGRAPGRGARGCRVLTGPPSHPPPPVEPARSTSARISSAPIAAGPWRSSRKNSTLPDGPGQRADRDGHGAPAALGGEVGDRGDRLGPQREVADHPALADALLADLELRLDHQRQLAVLAASRTAAGRAPGRGR